MKRNKITLALALTLAVGVLATFSLAALPAHAVSGELKPPPKNAVAGQYVVVFKNTVPASAVKSAVKDLANDNKVAATYKSALKGFVVKASAKEASKMASDPRVSFVQQDGRAKASAVQEIPSAPNSYWGLNRIDQRIIPPNSSGQYVYSYTGSGVHAYIIDSGIQTAHGQFGSPSRATFDFTAAGLSDPGVDCNGHGTHVAGTVGGVTYGVAKNVRLHAIKVLDCDGEGLFSQIIAGVDHVTANAIKPAVANMSLGGGSFLPLDLAVNKSIESGVTYAIAAGNDSADACDVSPARTLSAITVGATGNNANPNAPISDARSSFSNFGECLDIFAPGAHIRSASGTSNTAAATLSGTSMAAPHVAGVAALVLQKNPNRNPLSVRNYIVNFAHSSLVTSPGVGSPNKLLYAGGIPALSTNASPEPIVCPRNIKVKGKLTIHGEPLASKTIEVWFNKAGPVGPVLKKKAVTSATGTYTRTVNQNADGYWYTVYRGTALVGSKKSSADYVNCSNR